MTGSDRALRRDAARNRERLLGSARELFAERGLGVTLNDIAHHAGVGVGTAYRRFSNKDEIIDALFEEGLQAIADLASTCLAQHDPWKSITDFLEGSLELQFGDLGLNQIMNDNALGRDRVSDARDRIAPLIEALVDRARKEGAVRADLDQSDLIFIQVGLSAIMQSSREIRPELYRRYLALFLDGIRSDRSDLTPLPTPALSPFDTHRAMTRDRPPGS